MGKLASYVGLAVLLVLGCQRAEGVAPTEVDRSNHATATEPGTGKLATPSTRTASTPRAACVIPSADPPPPQAAPAARCPLAPDIAVPPTHGRVTFVDTPKKLSIDVELARTPEDQQRGLMYRTHLDEYAGMLFSWSDERVRTFWMHNTCVSLDMLFIAQDGVISGILEQVPVLNDEPRSVDCPAVHVLEVGAGFCRKHGIAPGQRIQISNN